MCGRYYVDEETANEIEHIVRSVDSRTIRNLSGDIHPSELAAVLTGRKLDQKVYRHHSGYIGGMKETSARVMMENKPEQAMMLAIKGMLPHNSLGRQMVKKLRVYAGSEHENIAQKPEVWEVK